LILPFLSIDSMLLNLGSGEWPRLSSQQADILSIRPIVRYILPMNAEPSIKRHAVGLLVGLALQYLLGMYINMYVQFPDTKDAGQLWEFAWKQPAIAAHIVLAILLFLGSIALAVRAQRLHITVWAGPGLIGFLAIFVAGFAGSRFIPTQGDPYSYLMAASFLVAFGAYCWGLYRAKRL
jgi:hypothetical protein